MLGELFSIYFLNTTMIFYTLKYFHLEKFIWLWSTPGVYAQAM